MNEIEIFLILIEYCQCRFIFDLSSSLKQSNESLASTRYSFSIDPIDLFDFYTVG